MKTCNTTIFRIHNVKGGLSHVLWHGVDGGKWIEMKRQRIISQFGEEVVPVRI